MESSVIQTLFSKDFNFIHVAKELGTKIFAQ